MKKIKHFLISVFLVLLLVSMVEPLNAESDSAKTEWRNTYGPISVNSIIQTNDGGYAMLTMDGAHYSHGSNQNYWYNTYIKLTKLDENGSISWVKPYYDEIGGTTPISLVQTKDNGFLIYGTFDATCYYLRKTDSQGNIEWDKTRQTFSFSTGLVSTHENGYLIYGQNHIDDFTTVQIDKIDENGNLLWRKTVMNSTGIYVDSLIQTPDGGYAIVGLWDSDFWFLKLDKNGEVEINKRHNFAPNQRYTTFRAVSISMTKGNKYIVSGTERDHSAPSVSWLILLDSEFNIIWNYNCFESTFPAYYFHAFQVDDGGFVGAVYSDGGKKIFKTDNNGIMKWNTTISNISRIDHFIQTKDNGYLCAANKVKYSTSPSANITLVKFLPDSPVADLEQSISEIDLIFTLAVIVITTGIVVVTYSIKKKEQKIS